MMIKTIYIFFSYSMRWKKIRFEFYEPLKTRLSFFKVYKKVKCYQKRFWVLVFNIRIWYLTYPDHKLGLARGISILGEVRNVEI